MLNQLNLNSDAPKIDLNSNKSDSNQENLIAYFFKKFIFAKT